MGRPHGVPVSHLQLWGASLQKPGNSGPSERNASGSRRLPEASRVGDRHSGCFWGRALPMLLIGVRVGVATGGRRVKPSCRGLALGRARDPRWPIITPWGRALGCGRGKWEVVGGASCLVEKRR